MWAHIHVYKHAQFSFYFVFVENTGLLSQNIFILNFGSRYCLYVFYFSIYHLGKENELWSANTEFWSIYHQTNMNWVLLPYGNFCLFFIVRVRVFIISNRYTIFTQFIKHFEKNDKIFGKEFTPKGCFIYFAIKSIIVCEKVSSKNVSPFKFFSLLKERFKNDYFVNGAQCPILCMALWNEQCVLQTKSMKNQFDVHAFTQRSHNEMPLRNDRRKKRIKQPKWNESMSTILASKWHHSNWTPELQIWSYTQFSGRYDDVVHFAASMLNMCFSNVYWIVFVRSLLGNPTQEKKNNEISDYYYYAASFPAISRFIRKKLKQINYWDTFFFCSFFLFQSIDMYVCLFFFVWNGF